MKPMSVREYLTKLNKASIQTSTGGQLEPDESRKFIHTTIDQTGFLSTVTRQEVIAATANIEVMGIAARVLRAATENVAFTTSTAPTISQRTLTKTTVKLFYRVTDEFLHQNIERESISEVLNEKFATAFGNDLEDLSVNGDDGSGDSFININNGWLDIMLADGSVNDVDATAMADDFLNLIFPAMLNALPNKYAGNKGALVYLVGTDSENEYAEQLGSRETGLGDSMVLQATQMKYRGIPVFGHPYMPDTSAVLTLRENLVFGFGTLMTRESERQPSIGLGATDWYLNAEIDYNYAVSDACVLASNV